LAGPVLSPGSVRGWYLVGFENAALPDCRFGVSLSKI
jgi:hypothetical protein